jgi:geranylgeranyl transferase type-1 subunit beta
MSLFVSAHVRFCLALLPGGVCLPADALPADAHRASLVYFSLSSLDLLGALPGALPPPSAAATARWLLAVLRAAAPSTAMVYACLASLAILGDAPALAAVDGARVRAALRAAQAADGGVRAAPGAEADVRFVYAALAARALLRRAGVAGAGAGAADLDARAAAAFAARCASHEGGFALAPGGEAHGGSTYCAVAALALAAAECDGAGAALRARAPAAHRWLAARQLPAGAAADGAAADGAGGMCGRAGKPADACYAFWVVAAQALLARAGGGHWPPPVAAAPLHAALLACQHLRPGGFGRDADTEPDPLHTHYALAGLALTGFPGLREMDPALGISARAAARLDAIAAGQP